MTALLRCRGAVSEMASQFAAEPDEALAWTPIIWPGEPALVVAEREGRRVLRTLPWGLPAATFIDRQRAKARRGTLFPRDLRADAGVIDDPADLGRCLIVLESFAYPDGEPRRRTRAWAGLWDRPLAGWAGVLTESAAGEQGCAGILVMANPLVERVSRHMPLLVDPDDYGAWLDGTASLLSLTAITDEHAYYLEATDERWSTGAAMEDEG